MGKDRAVHAPCLEPRRVCCDLRAVCVDSTPSFHPLPPTAVPCDDERRARGKGATGAAESGAYVAQILLPVFERFLLEQGANGGTLRELREHSITAVRIKQMPGIIFSAFYYEACYDRCGRRKMSEKLPANILLSVLG